MAIKSAVFNVQGGVQTMMRFFFRENNLIVNVQKETGVGPTEDYELLVEGLRSCADLASLIQHRRPNRSSSMTKEMPKKRRKLKLDPNATHLA
ncbi:hypothetical protein KIN20_022745 [Parelaphostrongylus tenuis]|uniref:Uncharacterized protein n=1 Tax=Parelaphostrongylus tenuis TaxID=148309 RepID=A0AAD5MQZ4_PARTN|nr:hypothetical protein KIN20_022745 [Parelaphostrongylus tenuis]